MAPSARASPAPGRRFETPDIDSPVFRFHTTDRGLDDARRNRYAAVHPLPPQRLDHNDSPWTLDEHTRFLHALETVGCGQSTSVVAAWHAIAAAVATRSVPDVKRHANDYFAQLQIVNVQRRKEFLAMQQIDARWTMHEDALLEGELATQSVSYPWTSIARRVPGKTPRDARERYHKLCYDVSRIESGQHVLMHLRRHSLQPQPSDDSDATGIDAVVTLTPAETQLLLRALEQTSVPSHASPDVLAAVASGVTSLACTTHKQPPRRATPLFSLDDARRVIERAIYAELTDTADVLELLAQELRLRPRSSLLRLGPRPVEADLHDYRPRRHESDAFPVPTRGPSSFPYSHMPTATSYDRHSDSNQDDDCMDDYY